MGNVSFDINLFSPSYRNLVENKDRYLVLWGGRDSGKSYFAAQKQIYDCLRLKYFRCILVKKTYESIKDSQFQTIKDIVYDYGLESLFDFKTSPLEIVCKNGNKWIARGCDKPEKLKSIKDPSHVWYEEANHLTYEDFATITSTIRGGDENQEIFSFNPEYNTPTIEEFWIYKMWFAGISDNSFSGIKKIDIDGAIYELPYTVQHTTYSDNPYCKPERIAILESYKTISEYMYNVFTKGLWTVKKIANPFITSFDRGKHLSEKAVFDKQKEIYLSFDFNIDNTVCTLSHHVYNSIHIFDGLSAHNLPDLVKKIKHKYGKYYFNFKITGDYAGNSRNAIVSGELTPYRLIKNELGLKDNQFRLRVNPQHKGSRFLCNTILAFHPEFLINPTLKELIYDIENVECDQEERIVKKDRNVANQKADWLDSFRYNIQNWHYDFVKNHVVKK